MAEPTWDYHVIASRGIFITRLHPLQLLKVNGYFQILMQNDFLKSISLEETNNAQIPRHGADPRYLMRIGKIMTHDQYAP